MDLTQKNLELTQRFIRPKDQKLQDSEVKTIQQDDQDQQSNIEGPPESRLMDYANIQIKKEKKQKKEPTKQINKTKLTKTKLWTLRNTELFYRLFRIFGGSFDLILDYFVRHKIDERITKQKIKLKYKAELKDNPAKLYDKIKKPYLQEKILKKMTRLAERDLSLIQKWSSISEFDKNQVVGIDEYDAVIQRNIIDQINEKLQQDRQMKIDSLKQ